MHLSLDLRELTGEAKHLAEARELGNVAKTRFWKSSGARGLFVRGNADRYYEAKLRPGELGSALLRLWLHEQGRTEDARNRDWNF